MHLRRSPWALALVLPGTFQLAAQDVKVNAVLDIWYTQMMDTNLRVDKAWNTPSDAGTPPPAEPATLSKNQPGAAYYQLNSAFTENGFSIRRAEIYFSGNVNEAISWNVLFDPNTSTSSSSPTTLLDAFITYKPDKNWSVKLGQFKPLQTYEASMVTTSELLFYDRSQLARQFGDKRDRGIVVGYAWGNPDGLAGKINAGICSGSGDKDGGKANDANAQKDFVTRFEFTYGKTQKFGFYTRNGSTDAADKGSLKANRFAYAASGAPSDAEILDNKDKTTNMGAYYAFENSEWIAQAEAVTGLLGRRFASVGVAAPDPYIVAYKDPETNETTNITVVPGNPAAMRQYLDQKYLGYVLTGGYKMGRNTFLVRYDFLNYNQGDKYYGTYNPYTQKADGSSRGADYTPKYTEIIAGWNYAFAPDKWKLANFKLNYIARSKNFLKPGTNQTGERGGDSLVAALQIGF